MRGCQHASETSALFALAGLRPHEVQLIEVDYSALLENVGKAIDAAWQQ